MLVLIAVVTPDHRLLDAEVTSSVTPGSEICRTEKEVISNPVMQRRKKHLVEHRGITFKSLSLSKENAKKTKNEPAETRFCKGAGRCCAGSFNSQGKGWPAGVGDLSGGGAQAEASAATPHRP